MLDKTYIRNNNIITRKILDETILVPIRNNVVNLQRIFSLNSVSVFIWQQLDGKRNIEEILNCILKTFEVNRETAEADLYEFISELLKEGVIAEADCESD